MVNVKIPLQIEEEKKDEEEEDEVEEYEKRVQLPILRDPHDRPSMWKILKSAVGKDLGKFSVPVYMNEPLSMIQKIVEIMEYEDLLVQANQSADSKKRIMLIAAFGAAQYACSARRTSKPFNPILGETYEYVCSRFKYIGE